MNYPSPRPWWVRVFRPGPAERRTEAMLAEVREALRKLDLALSLVERAHTHHSPPPKEPDRDE